MVTTVHTPYIAEPLGLVMRRGLENPRKDSASTDGGSFESMLEKAAEPALPPSAPRQVSAGPAETHQGNPAPAAPAASPAAVPELDRMPGIPADRSGRVFTDYEDPTPLVQAELAKMGIDPSAIRFERWDWDEKTVGGRITNHLLRAYIPGGGFEDYSIEWTLRSPRITANDIGKRMGWPAPPMYVNA